MFQPMLGCSCEAAGSHKTGPVRVQRRAFSRACNGPDPPTLQGKVAGGKAGGSEHPVCVRRLRGLGAEVSYPAATPHGVWGSMGTIAFCAVAHLAGVAALACTPHVGWGNCPVQTRGPPVRKASCLGAALASTGLCQPARSDNLSDLVCWGTGNGASASMASVSSMDEASSAPSGPAAPQPKAPQPRCALLVSLNRPTRKECRCALHLQLGSG